MTVEEMERQQKKQLCIDNLNRLPLYLLYNMYANCPFDYLVIENGKIVDVKEY